MREARLAEAVLAMAMLAACAPLTTYRNSAHTPGARPIDWDGVPAERGALRGDLSISHDEVTPNFAPQAGDTAVWSANTMLDGSIGFAIARGLELGLRGSFAAPRWGEESAAGTLPIPGGGPVWGVGPELRGALFVDRSQRFSLGIAVNAMDYQVPTATWQLAACAPSSTCIPQRGPNGQFANYQLTGESTAALLAVNAGLYPSYSLGDGGRYGHVFAMLGLHTGFANDGFSDTLSPSSGTVWSNGFIGMAGSGYSVQIDRLHLGAMFYLPFTGTTSAVNEGPGVMLTLGIVML